jgi:osmotically-inducible protein OsmY
MRLKSSVCLVVLAGICASDHAVAQMFFGNSAARGTTSGSTSPSRLGTGTRTTGGSVTNKATGQAGQGQSDSANPMLGGEWRIRRSHGRGSFVGADARDKTGFVGSEQASEGGALRSAIDNSRIRVAIANQALLPRRKDEMYRPKLTVAFDLPAMSGQTVSSAVAQRLKTVPGLQATSPLAVSVEGRIATLRGEVASERDRALAQQLVLFEPGIDEVHNLLTVKPPRAAPSATAPAAQRPK